MKSDSVDDADELGELDDAPEIDGFNHATPAVRPIKGDLINGTLMAVCVALVPNAMQAIVLNIGSDVSLKSKLYLISALGAGAAVTAPIIFGRKGPSGGWQHRFGFPVLLGFAGIVAAAYFLAVVGFRPGHGLGAGIAETFDSSLAPTFYLLASFCAGSATLTRKSVAGLMATLLGLLLVSAALLTATMKDTGSLQLGDAVLIPFGVLGALGTAVSLWILRRMVRSQKAELGFCVSCRYLGVAIAFYLAASCIAGESRAITLAATQAFVAGALLITAAFYFAVRVESEFVTAAAMATIPLMALIIEAGFCSVGLIASANTPFGSTILWLGVAVTALGVWFLQS
jgi:hypothetical protein